MRLGAGGIDLFLSHQDFACSTDLSRALPISQPWRCVGKDSNTPTLLLGDEDIFRGENVIDHSRAIRR